MLVSCEHAALVDGRDYLQPVITPWEAQVAFTHGAHWDGEVRLDFDHLLEPRGGASALGALARREEGRREETPEFSFLGGGVRAGPRRRVPGEPRDEDEASSSEGEEEGDENEGVLGDGSVRVKSKAATALATRASAAVAARAGGSGIADVRSGAEYLLSRRTYTGLEPGPRRDEDGAAALRRRRLGDLAAQQRRREAGAGEEGPDPRSREEQVQGKDYNAHNER